MKRDGRGEGVTWVLPVVLTGLMMVFLASEARSGQFDVGVSTYLSERYDDNINLDEKQFEEEDFITSITPNISLSYLNPGTNLSLIYNPAIEFYARHSSENEVRQNGNLNLTSQLTPRLSLTMVDSLALVPGEQLASQDYYTSRNRMLRSTGSDVLTNTFTSTLAYKLFQNTTVRGGFSYSMDNYSGSQQADSNEYSFNTGIDHQLTGRDTLFSNYQYRMIRYKGGSQLIPKSDSNIHYINVGETHQFPREVVLTISGGPLFIDQKIQGNESNWNAQAMVSKSFRTGSIVLSYNRDAAPSDGQGSTTMDNTVNLTAIKDFTRRLNGMFTAYYSTSKSTSSKSVFGNRIDDKDWGITLSSRYQFTRQLTGDISGSFVRQNSRGGIGSLIVYQGRGTGDTDQYRGQIGVDYSLRQNWSFFSNYRYYRQNALNPGALDIDDNIIEIGTRVTWF